MWNNLPEPSKGEIIGRRRKCRITLSKGPKDKENEKIELTEPLKRNLILWTEDPDSFLLPNTNKELITQGVCPVAMFYGKLSEAEIQGAGDVIRLRFLKVLFYHLKERFCVTYQGATAIDWLTTRVSAAGLDNGDTSKISGKLKEWVYLGGKYDALCRDLGRYQVVEGYKYLGILIRLPDNFTDRL